MFKRFDRVTVSGRAGIIARIGAPDSLTGYSDAPCFGVMFEDDLEANVYFLPETGILHQPPSPDRTTPITGEAKTIDGRIDEVERVLSQPAHNVQLILERLDRLEALKIDYRVTNIRDALAQENADLRSYITESLEHESHKHGLHAGRMDALSERVADLENISIEDRLDTLEKLKRRVKKLWREWEAGMEPGDDEKGQAEEYFRASDLVDVKVGHISLYTTAREFKPGDEVVVTEEMIGIERNLKVGEQGILVAPTSALITRDIYSWVAKFDGRDFRIDLRHVKHADAKPSAIISDNLKGAKIGEFLREWEKSGFEQSWTFDEMSVYRERYAELHSRTTSDAFEDGFDFAKWYHAYKTTGKGAPSRWTDEEIITAARSQGITVSTGWRNTNVLQFARNLLMGKKPA